ncbi:MAG: hypothetical protein H6Q74_1245 [Firmicutes bacterium]|nr:hypothetical protein [Bacillota bacterium]
MPEWWIIFASRIIVALVCFTTGFNVWPGLAESPTVQAVAIPEGTVAIWNIPSDTVNIKVLPPRMTLSGKKVVFSGKKTIPQTFVDQLAQEIEIVNFEAEGENAKKSAIKIVWEDGGVDMVSPGTKTLRFSPARRAKEISIIGYSMHEHKIFRDSPQPGTLSWEIRYVAVAN